MTEGQVVYGSDAGEVAAPRRGRRPAPTAESSGVAQSVVGAPPSDQVAAGQEPENPAG